MGQTGRGPGGSVNAGALSDRRDRANSSAGETRPHSHTMTATPRCAQLLPRCQETGCVHTGHGFISVDMASPTIRVREPAGQWFHRAVPPGRETTCGGPSLPRSADSVQPSRAHAPPSPTPLPAPLVALGPEPGMAGKAWAGGSAT